MIYDEQPPSAPPSRSTSVFEEPHGPVTGDSTVRAQTRDQAELQDAAPGRKSASHQSLLQKNASKRDAPAGHGHGDKKNFLKVENGVSQQGRSASPKKPASRYAEDHLETIPGTLKSDPKRRDRSSSPRRGESKSGPSSARAGPGQDPARSSRGRSSSPKKQPRAEGSRDPPGAPASDGAQPASNGVRQEARGPPGKTRARSPEKRSKRLDEKSLPSKKTPLVASRGASEGEKGKRAPFGDASEKLRPDPEADSSRRAPITPGPWKVPSANKASGSTGVAERRL